MRPLFLYSTCTWDNPQTERAWWDLHPFKKNVYRAIESSLMHSNDLVATLTGQLAKIVPERAGVNLKQLADTFLLDFFQEHGYGCKHRKKRGPKLPYWERYGAYEENP